MEEGMEEAWVWHVTRIHSHKTNAHYTIQNLGLMLVSIETTYRAS